jgi:uncharacterized protein YbaP (TraB family)
MTLLKSAILSILVLAGAVSAAAEVPLTPVPANPNDPDATLVEELVVVARDRGPAWWRVSDADTTVYVLGVPSVAPKHMEWDRSTFERRLNGANEVILPYGGLRVKLTGAPMAAISMMRLKSRTAFEDTLDPATKARFIAARTKLGQPAERYGTKNPMAAGLLLISDYRDRANLTDTDPSKLIRWMAQSKKVKVERKSYDLSPLMGAVVRTPAAAGRTCLEDALADVERGTGPTLAAVRAWSEGNVPDALGAERTYERCLAATPGALAFDTRTKTDQVAQIVKALQTPGHAIAVVQLRPLLAQGGVLDRLRALGFTVKTPGDE